MENSLYKKIMRKQKGKDIPAKAYYTWTEIKEKLYLQNNYVDPHVNFIPEENRTHCRNVIIIDYSGEYFECTVNQYFNIHWFKEGIFCPYDDISPTQKEWKKIRNMTVEQLNRYCKKIDRERNRLLKEELYAN